MIENLQREDLNPMEEAEGYQTLMQQYNMTQEETAQRVGKSRSAVANAMRLLKLCPPVRAMVEDGRLSSGHARAILPLSPAMQESAANAIIKDELSVRQTEQLVKKLTAPPSRSSRNRMGSPSIMPRRPPRNWVAVWAGAAALSRAEKRAASN